MIKYLKYAPFPAIIAIIFLSIFLSWHSSCGDLCQPSCRTGYTCISTTCVTLCNPVCDSTETCNTAGECEVIDTTTTTDTTTDTTTALIDYDEEDYLDDEPPAAPDELDEAIEEWVDDVVEDE